MRQLAADRVALAALLATLLFAGALRAFLSGVYYQNLATLQLNASALYALLLLAPLLFLVPAVRRRPQALLVAATLALVVGRALLVATRGSALHTPLAGVTAGSWLLLVGALVSFLRGTALAHAGTGIALGWALDAALLWYGDSSDPLATARGLFVVVPAGILLALLVPGLAGARTEAEDEARTPWLAGAAFGAWLFLAFTLAANPYGMARWNGVEPALVAGASVLGLLAGALAGLRWRAPWWAWLLALVALVDHLWLHVLPPLAALLLASAVAHAAPRLLAALATRRGGLALVAGGAMALALHFAYAFTFLFDYVPFGAAWEGQAPTVYLAAAALLAAALLRAPVVAPERRRARRLAPLAAAALLVGLAAVATPGSAILAPPSDGTLRLLAFNVHQGFSNDGVVDPEAFVAVIQEARADVVVLQESDTPRFTSANLDAAGYLAERMGYHLAYGQPTRAQAFGGAILSRHPIAEWQARELPSASDDRWYTEARLDVGGRPVWVYAVHLALPHEDRMAQTSAILAQAATRDAPRILAGDFNSCPEPVCADYAPGVPDDVYARITASYQDAWRVANPGAPEELGYTYEARAPEVRIDHVFVSDGIEVRGATVHRSEAALAASDHLPVLAVLAVGPT